VALGRAALGLSAADRALLDLVGRHPFLSPARAAAVLGWPVVACRRRLGRLLAGDLLQRPRPGGDEAAGASARLLELTAGGLRLVASQQGLTLAAAVRANGLAGGGPDQPLGARRQLLAHLRHTLGADAVFVGLAALAHRTAAGDALVEWRSAAACARGPMRPDGYGLYRHSGRLYGFFLEYDRGTMRARDYRRKFAAYHAYRAGGGFERDYDGFPTILVVTTDGAAEARIARAAGAAATGRESGLPVLLTCRWRLEDARNPLGPLGPVWREARARGRERRVWPLAGAVRPP
jgi:hypothetical protein